MDSLMRCINRTARCSILYRAEKLEAIGLNGVQHTYILNICRNPGVSQERLSELLFINKSNIARQLAILEQDGFVVRTPDQNDRRILRVFPTQKAEDAVPIVLEVLHEWNDYVTADFTEEEKHLLYSMMEKVMNKAADYVKEKL